MASPFRKGKIIRSDAREIIANVLEFCENERDGCIKIPLCNVRVRVAAMTGISEATIGRIASERKRATDTGTKITTPRKKRKLRSKKTDSVEDFDLGVLKRHIQDLYVSGVIPTLKSIHKFMCESLNFCGSKSTTRKILRNKLGLKYSKVNGRLLLMERSDIVVQRRHFLRRIKQHQVDSKHIFYQDESFIHQNHATTQMQQRCKTGLGLDNSLDKNSLLKLQPHFVYTTGPSVPGWN